MKVTLYRVSAFPEGSIGGNEAGVVLDAENLSDAQMLAIAHRVNYSETAFVMKSNNADFLVRYFSPIVEVPLCGHATIATFNLMRNLELVTLGHYTIETLKGIFKVEVKEKSVSMQLAPPIFHTILDKEEVSKKIGIPINQFNALPVQVVSAGLFEIFLGLNTLKELHALTLNEDDINKFCKEHNALGLYIYTLETVHGSTAHGRNFIPPVGVYEESATGTASGAFACYLNKHHNPNQLEYLFEQGHSLFKPSRIESNLIKENDEIVDVYIGGRMRFIDKITGFNPGT